MREDQPERSEESVGRGGTSGFARMPPDVVDRVGDAVGRDLHDGTWDERHGYLCELEEYDADCDWSLPAPRSQPERPIRRRVSSIPVAPAVPPTIAAPPRRPAAAPPRRCRQRSPGRASPQLPPR
jgi:hypothetical protein